MNGRRKDTTEAEYRSKADEARWSEYAESNQRNQKELADLHTLIENATQIIVSWPLNKSRAGSGAIGWTPAEDNPDVLSLQEQFAKLAEIIAHQTKRNYSPRDAEEWSATVAGIRFLSRSKRLRRLLLKKVNIWDGVRRLLKKRVIVAEEVRYAGQTNLARLVDQLPMDLPGVPRFQPPHDLTEVEQARHPKLPKPVREGATVEILHDQLRRVRNLYRDNGWTSSQIRSHTGKDFSTLWEWVDRLPISDQKIFLAVHDWDSGDAFIYRQIATLYVHSRHLRRPPSAATVRDWRKKFRQSKRRHSEKITRVVL